MQHIFPYCIESRVENNRSLYGRFQLGPFDKGQSLTIANTLRRTLLSELNGLAILCVEIQGVSHEYCHLRGIRESVLDILLNLRQIAFISNKKYHQPEIGFLSMQGPAVIKACDLKLPSFMQCVDPNQYIATLANNGILEMKFMICEGKNFVVQTPSELIQKCFQSHFKTQKQAIHQLSEQINAKRQTLNNGLKKKKKHYLQAFETFLSEKNANNNEIKNIFMQNQPNFQKFEKDLMFHKQKMTKLESKNQKITKSESKNQKGTKSESKNQKITKSKNQKITKSKSKKSSTNLLFIDAIFIPIKKVNFSIQAFDMDHYYNKKSSDFLAELKKDYPKEKIILEIWTNGSIHPEKCIYEGFRKIIDIFIPLQKTYSYKKIPFYKNDSVFTNQGKMSTIGKKTNFKTQLNLIYRPWFHSIQFQTFQNYLLNKQKKIAKSTNLINIAKKFEFNQSIANQLKFFDISYLKLPTSLYVCLKRAKINTIQDLLLYSRNELLLIKNVKEKSVKKIEIFLAKHHFKLRNEM